MQEHIDANDIKLVDDQRKTLFRDEMQKIGQKGDRADASPERDGQHIDAHELEGAQLYMSEEAAQAMQASVQDEVRKRQL